MECNVKTTTERRVIRLAATVGLVLVLGSALALAEPPPFARVFEELPGAPGSVAGSGRVVEAGEIVRAVNDGVLVRLESGPVLRLAPNSAVQLVAGAEGDVQVRVLSGQLAMVDEKGRPHYAGSGSVFKLEPTLEDAERAEARVLALDLGRAGRGERDGKAATRP